MPRISTKNFRSTARRLVIVVILISQPSLAFEPMQGCVVITKSCPVGLSIRQAKSAAGGMSVQSGKEYPLVGRNRDKNPSHYQIRLPEGNYWIGVECAKIPDSCQSTDRTLTNAQDLLLAVNWQPAFCESHPGKHECKSQHDERFDAKNLSLHGLWPQPRSNVYCGVSGRLRQLDQRGEWSRLPALALSQATREELQKVMPGEQSHLDRHEWLKHGTCYSEMEEDYYRDSLRLMRELNASRVTRAIASSTGTTIEVETIRDAFDQTFGEGNGKKIAFDCDTDGNLTAIHIPLRGDATQESIDTMLDSATALPADCREATVRIDTVGIERKPRWFWRWFD